MGNLAKIAELTASIEEKQDKSADLLRQLTRSLAIKQIYGGDPWSIGGRVRSHWRSAPISGGHAATWTFSVIVGDQHQNVEGGTRKDFRPDEVPACLWPDDHRAECIAYGIQDHGAQRHTLHGRRNRKKIKPLEG